MYSSSDLDRPMGSLISNTAEFPVDVRACHIGSDQDISISVASSLLSRKEQERAERFVFDRDRERYVRGRGFLRTSLEQTLGIPAAQIEFGTVANDKPVLKGGGDVHFNMSHSGNLAVVAISRNRSVGIDVEFLDREVDPLSLAESCFTRSETKFLAGDVQQTERFFHYWTAKEAFMKLTGDGLDLSPKRIALKLDPAGWPVGYTVDDRARANLSYVDLPDMQAICCLAYAENAADNPETKRGRI